MSATTPRHWVGYLSGDSGTELILFDRHLPCRSPHEVWLYHYRSNQLQNHFKYPIREYLRPLGKDGEELFERVKTAYLEYKLNYYRELGEFLRSSFYHKLPEEFITLRYYDQSKGKDWYEFFYSDPDWELAR